VPTADDEPAVEDRSTLGVLVVHGIGRQRQGVTMERWANALQAWLDPWVRRGEAGEERVRFAASEVRPGPGVAAHAVLDVDGQRWTVAECWWGEVSYAPAPSTVGLWALGLGTRLIQRYVQRHQPAPPGGAPADGAEGEFGGLASMAIGTSSLYYILIPVYVLTLVVLFAGMVVANVLLLAVVALLLVSGLLPGPLKKPAANAALALADSLGDAYLLKRNPSSRAAMGTRFDRELTWLRGRCDRVVVVAHSQGAVIAHDVLRRRPAEDVAHLVTIGAGLRPLADGPDDDEHAAAIDGMLTLHDGAVPWTDLYASADPVPDGPLWRVQAPPGATSRPVRNSGSVVFDHTGYTRNLDELVAQLALLLAAEAGHPSIEADARVVRAAAQRRGRRVGVLMAARVVFGIVSVVLLAALSVGWLEDVGAWARPGVEAVTPKVKLAGQTYWLGAAVVLAACAVAYAPVLGLWRASNAAAVVAMARRRPSSAGYRHEHLTWLWTTVVLAGTGAVVVLRLPEAWWAVGLGLFVYVIVLGSDLGERWRRDRWYEPPHLLAGDDPLAPGTELAWRDGFRIRRVRVVEDDAPPGGAAAAFEVVQVLVAGGEARTVEVLDDRPSARPKGKQRPERGERVEVRYRAHFAGTWGQYAAWKGEREGV
jgi:hypothetical protein